MRNSSSNNKLKNSTSNLRKSMNNFISSQIKYSSGENHTNINTPKYIETILSEKDPPKSPSFKISSKTDIQSIL